MKYAVSTDADPTNWPDGDLFRLWRRPLAGFSLVELLVVIAIIATLIGLVRIGRSTALPRRFAGR